jgi:3'-phosphoadenosine 5'-phosphosulfate sulfotransferase (PAPS reductase)/FAD synthetase
MTTTTTLSPPSSPHSLSNLRELEAEAIHIIREVAAEFENPVMLYSIGKDSSVMVRLAEKAFYPGKVPFPHLNNLNSILPIAGREELIKKTE